jgi:hypothetical protein
MLDQIPGVKRIERWVHGRNRYLRFAPPGHYYSPIPDATYVATHRARIFNRTVEAIPGIDLRTEAQLGLVKQLAPYCAQLPFPEQPSVGSRYYFDNQFFCYGDALVLYGMLRHLRPQRVIEVGSGFSSAVMLDTNDRFLARNVEFTFIEPYPDRLNDLLSDEDRSAHRIIASPVQDVSPAVFQTLRANDILFIDSSHVGKVGSDVVYLMNEIVPTLRPGVYVHIHDLMWPFEYPEDWILGGRAWNEAYLVRAFLQFNHAFEIVCFNSYLGEHYADVMAAAIPRFMNNSGGSFWIRRVE